MVRLAIVLPTLFSALTAVLMSGHALWAGGMGLLVVLSLFLRPRLNVQPKMQSLLAVLAAVAAGLVVTVSVPAADLLGYPAFGAPWRALALFGLFLSVPRFGIQAPWGGSITTTGASLLTMLGLGAGRDHALYPWALVVYGLCLWGSSRLLDPSRTPWVQLGWTRIGVAGGALLSTIALAWGAALVLPPVHDRAQGYAVQALNFDAAGRRSGFSTNLQLGAMKAMLQSDEKVLRIDGPAPDHLRGVVYTTYRFGRWFAAASAAPKPVHSAAEGGTLVQVLSPQGGVVFVPLEAASIGSAQALAVNDLGVHSGFEGQVEDYWFDLDSGGDRVQVMAPDEDDLRVPERMQDALRATALAVTSSATAPRTQLLQLVSFFHSEFEYSLSFERPSTGDPVLHFLSTGRQGHCEYFASAMTLLARRMGIPARVVGGYLVVERNALTGKVIVRQKHAHAWVEAWVDGAWVTFDPTPPAGLAASMGRETPTLEAYWDWLTDGLARLRAHAVPHIFWIAALPFLWLARGYIGPWLRRRQERPTAAIVVTGPKAYMVPLFECLQQAGLQRAPGESLERFGARVQVASIAYGAQASSLLTRYAALRYGGQGDEAALIAGVTELIKTQAEGPA